jgi:nitrogen fixation protein NifU and related proteins
MQNFYREILLDHFQHPRNRRELEDADIEKYIDNPLCGDVVTVYANVHDGVFEEVSFTGRGCSISQASASMLTEQLTGKSRDEVEEKLEAFMEMMRTEENEELGELAALKGIVQTPNRIRCATLAWDAMRRAISGL